MNEEKFSDRQRDAFSGSLAPHLAEQELVCGRWDLDRVPGVSGNENKIYECHISIFRFLVGREIRSILHLFCTTLRKPLGIGKERNEAPSIPDKTGEIKNLKF